MHVGRIIGTGGGGAIRLVLGWGEGSMDVAGRSAGDGTPGSPERDFMQMNLTFIYFRYKIQIMDQLYWK